MEIKNLPWRASACERDRTDGFTVAQPLCLYLRHSFLPPPRVPPRTPSHSRHNNRAVSQCVFNGRRLHATRPRARSSPSPLRLLSVAPPRSRHRDPLSTSRSSSRDRDLRFPLSPSSSSPSFSYIVHSSSLRRSRVHGPTKGPAGSSAPPPCTEKLCLNFVFPGYRGILRPAAVRNTTFGSSGSRENETIVNMYTCNIYISRYPVRLANRALAWLSYLFVCGRAPLTENIF